MTKTISLPSVIGAGYGAFWRSRHRYLVCKGGKASKKSTTAALRFIYNLMKYPGANLLVVRKVGRTHKDSTFAQLRWAMHRLGVSDAWACTVSPLEMVYKPNGNKVLFRGFDDAEKIASTTVAQGFLCWVWLEEAFELDSESDFDKLDLSVPRGAIPAPLWKETVITFNPWSEHHWLKRRFFDNPPADCLTMTTNYKCNEFLDSTDIAIYERMKQEQPRKYDVAGLGNWGIAEGLVFENWTVSGFDLEEITADKPWQWRHIFGLDYGYTNDPTAFIAACVNPRERLLYIYDEHYQHRMLNSDIAEMIKAKGYSKERIRADSAEPKSNDDLRRLGIGRLQPAEKGKDSIINGINAIQEYRVIISPNCRNTAAEMASYCWDTDREGNTINRPVDSNNHLMDALRYAMLDVKGWMPPERKPRVYMPEHGAISAADMAGGAEM